MESNRIEYKRELTDSLEKEVVAFLNYRDGGEIYIGIDNGGTTIGVAESDQVQLTIKDRMNVENTIFTKIKVPLREERPMINPIALREAVVNAIVHNDYSNGSVPKFEFFSDRLEITSAGGLPYGLELEDFFAGHTAPRNKEIMRIFRDLEIVEHLGSGIPRILEVYGKDVFQISRNFMRLIFPYAYTLPQQASAGQQSTEVRPKNFVKIAERLRNGFGMNVEHTFTLICENPYVTAMEIAEKINKSSRTIESYINSLKKEGVIKRQGPKLGGYWEILEKHDEQ